MGGWEEGVGGGWGGSLLSCIILPGDMQKGGGGAEIKRKRVIEKVEREKRRTRKGGSELVKTKTNFLQCLGNQDPHPNQ